MVEPRIHRPTSLWMDFRRLNEWSLLATFAISKIPSGAPHVLPITYRRKIRRVDSRHREKHSSILHATSLPRCVCGGTHRLRLWLGRRRGADDQSTSHSYVAQPFVCCCGEHRSYGGHRRNEFPERFHGDVERNGGSLNLCRTFISFSGDSGLGSVRRGHGPDCGGKSWTWRRNIGCAQVHHNDRAGARDGECSFDRRL